MAAAKKRSSQDKENEKLIRALMNIIKDSGLEVRRERLKQGAGWKAASGTCRLHSKDLLFIDRRLPLEEQLNMLLFRLRSMREGLNQEDFSELPDRLQKIVFGG